MCAIRGLPDGFQRDLLCFIDSNYSLRDANVELLGKLGHLNGRRLDPTSHEICE